MTKTTPVYIFSEWEIDNSRMVCAYFPREHKVLGSFHEENDKIVDYLDTLAMTDYHYSDKKQRTDFKNRVQKNIGCGDVDFNIFKSLELFIYNYQSYKQTLDNIAEAEKITQPVFDDISHIFRNNHQEHLEIAIFNNDLGQIQRNKKFIGLSMDHNAQYATRLMDTIYQNSQKD